jgi:hypothetical protein
MDKQPPELKRTRQRRWAERNPLKRWAHLATANALRYGLLQRQACEHCGAEMVDAHHPDHANPLEVVWLCRPCHKREHARLKAGGQ